MKIFVLLFTLFGFVGAMDKINIVVSVIPQIYFVKKIGGDYVNVSAMVPDGRSPETYEPLPSQARLIKNAVLYLGVGMEFEKIWLNRFAGVNPDMKFIDLSIGLDLDTSSHQHEQHRHDPHIWMSVALARIQAQKIYEAISQIDSIRKPVYKKNLDSFLAQINELDSQIKAIFSKPHAQKSFLVYHPAFGYLAKEYGLEEIALENEGKSPKTKQMIALKKLLEQKNIQTIFIQPQFSKKRIESIASDLKLKVLELDPLKKDWANNILYICKMIATQGSIH